MISYGSLPSRTPSEDRITGWAERLSELGTPRMTAVRTILCLASYHKGHRFLTRCKKEGCHVILLTIESLLGEAWPREFIDEVYALPTFADERAMLNAVSYLARTRSIDRVVALDDFDVEVAAAIREHFRLPGLGESA